MRGAQRQKAARDEPSEKRTDAPARAQRSRACRRRGPRRRAESARPRERRELCAASAERARLPAEELAASGRSGLGSPAAARSHAAPSSGRGPPAGARARAAQGRCALRVWMPLSRMKEPSGTPAGGGCGSLVLVSRAARMLTSGISYCRHTAATMFSLSRAKANGTSHNWNGSSRRLGAFRATHPPATGTSWWGRPRVGMPHRHECAFTTMIASSGPRRRSSARSSCSKEASCHPSRLHRKLEKDQQRPLVGTPGQLVIEAQLEERGARRRDRAVVVEVAAYAEAVLECVDELRVEEVAAAASAGFTEYAEPALIEPPSVGHRDRAPSLQRTLDAVQPFVRSTRHSTPRATVISSRIPSPRARHRPRRAERRGVDEEGRGGVR